MTNTDDKMRLNAKNSAQYSPLKNMTNQVVNFSQEKKQNFSFLLNNWELLITKNLTPAVFEEPKLKEKCEQQIPGMFRKSVKNWGPSSL